MSKLNRTPKNVRPLLVENLESRQLMASDLVGVVRANQWLLNKENTDPIHNMDLSYGLAGDNYVAGKWNSPVDHPGVVRTGSPDGLLHWYLDTDRDPTHELDFAYGLPGDKPVVGDWNGDGLDNMGVVRGNYPDHLLRWYLDTDGDSAHEIEYVFGLDGDVPITGDFNGDGIEDVAVVRGGYADGLLRTFVNYDHDPSQEDTFVFGRDGDLPLTGDYDSNNIDELTMVRVNPTNRLLSWYVNRDHDPGAEQTFEYGLPGDVPVVGNWQYAEISVRNAAGQEVSAVDFGRNLINSAKRSVTLTITNTGNLPLNLSKITVPSGFSFALPVNRLLPGTSTQFTISNSTNSSGLFSGAISITTNDGNENPKLIQLKSITYLPAPEITIICEDRLLDQTATGRGKIDFGNQPIFSTPIHKVFLIKNIGTATLTVSSVGVPTGYELVSGPANQIEPGNSTTFVVRMSTNTLGSRNGQIIVTNNDNNERNFLIDAMGNVNRGPEINVLVRNTPLQSGSTVSYGSPTVGQISTVTITIRNDGESVLHISSWNTQGPFRRVGGTLNQLQRDINPGSYVTLVLRIDTSTKGQKTGLLTIHSDDRDEQNFALHLSGIVR